MAAEDGSDAAAELSLAFLAQAPTLVPRFKYIYEYDYELSEAVGERAPPADAPGELPLHASVAPICLLCSSNSSRQVRSCGLTSRVAPQETLVRVGYCPNSNALLFRRPYSRPAPARGLRCPSCASPRRRSAHQPALLRRPGADGRLRRVHDR